MNIVVSKFELLWDDDHRRESRLGREISNVASRYGSGVLCLASTLQPLALTRLAVDVKISEDTSGEAVHP